MNPSQIMFQHQMSYGKNFQFSELLDFEIANERLWTSTLALCLNSLCVSCINNLSCGTSKELVISGWSAEVNGLAQGGTQSDWETSCWVS